jgi:hypothetical protein
LYDHEVAVKVPRFRLAWVMVFVVLAALNFTALRAALDAPSPTSELLALGAMPMATVLTMGLLIGHRRHVSRPFLLGFESFGIMALAVYVVLASCFAKEVVGRYASLFIEPVANIIGRNQPVIFIPIAYSVGVVVLGFPQVAFALIGGFLSRRYRITITKRSE